MTLERLCASWRRQSVSNEIWVLCTFNSGVPDRRSLELLNAAWTLKAERSEYTLCAVVFGSGESAAGFGCEKTYLLPEAGGESDAQGRVLAEAIRSYEPEIILALSTSKGRAITSIAAAAVGTGLTADCTDLSLRSDGVLIQTRPALGGNLIADIVCPERRPQMATVRPGVFDCAQLPAVSGQTIEFFCGTEWRGVKLLERRPLCGSGLELAESNVLVAGGLGIGSVEGFAELQELAEALGGRVAASRGAVNAGYAEYERQVGLSGMSVRPRIYLAIGISGAAQHLAGIRYAEKIIAVNSDPGAPIFRYADIGVVGDWHEFVPALLEQIKNTKRKPL